MTARRRAPKAKRRAAPSPPKKKKKPERAAAGRKPKRAKPTRAKPAPAPRASWIPRDLVRAAGGTKELRRLANTARSFLPNRGRGLVVRGRPMSDRVVVVEAAFWICTAGWKLWGLKHVVAACGLRCAMRPEDGSAFVRMWKEAGKMPKRQRDCVRREVERKIR